MYNKLTNTVKQFVTVNNITEFVGGDTNWYKLQGIIGNLYGSAINGPDFWGDIFFNICYDLNIRVSYED